MKVLRGEEWRRTPTFANRPLELEHADWPSVTIQIPIFRESFDDTIRPTLDAAREAARRYAASTGARCNLLVCDDGLLHFAANDLERALAAARRTAPVERSAAQAELVARMAYYEAFDVALRRAAVARGRGAWHRAAGAFPQGQQPELRAAPRRPYRWAAPRCPKRTRASGRRCRRPPTGSVAGRATSASARSSCSSTRTA